MRSEQNQKVELENPQEKKLLGVLNLLDKNLKIHKHGINELSDKFELILLIPESNDHIELAHLYQLTTSTQIKNFLTTQLSFIEFSDPRANLTTGLNYQVYQYTIDKSKIDGAAQNLQTFFSQQKGETDLKLAFLKWMYHMLTRSALITKGKAGDKPAHFDILIRDLSAIHARNVDNHTINNAFLYVASELNKINTFFIKNFFKRRDPEVVDFYNTCKTRIIEISTQFPFQSNSNQP